MNSDQNNQSNLNEEDIKILFGRSQLPAKTTNLKSAPLAPPQPTLSFQKFNWQAWFLGLLKITALFIVLFLISFTILNFPALWARARYDWQTDEAQNNLNLTQQFPPLATVNNHLIVPKIGVDAPIQWGVSDEDTLDALENGVAHYQGTALPGEIGNVFITGHSSYYFWSGGSYKQIFALLDKLVAGDRIYVNYQNIIFAYEVTGKNVVKPENLSVLTQGDGETLSLMTCVPVGTNLNRLVVTAKRIAL